MSVHIYIEVYMPVSYTHLDVYKRQDYDSIDEDTRNLYRKAMAAFGGIAPSYHIELLEKEAESLTQAARYERSEARQGYRSGHYDRNLTTTSGDVTLHVPRLKGCLLYTSRCV